MGKVFGLEIGGFRHPTLKLYINSFMNRHISHENSANEIFDALSSNLKPKWIKIIADFNPRGNVHTIITIDSKDN